MLLLEHKSFKKYLQPGGHAELKDNEIIDTAKREIFEETGLKKLKLVSINLDDENVPIDINTHFIPRNEKKNEEEHYHNDFRYLFVIQDESDIKIDMNESNGYKWIDIETLKKEENFKTVIDKIVSLVNNN